MQIDELNCASSMKLKMKVQVFARACKSSGQTYDPDQERILIVLENDFYNTQKCFTTNTSNNFEVIDGDINECLGKVGRQSAISDNALILKTA